MAESTRPLLLGRPARSTLITLSAVLAIMLAGVALVCSGAVGYRAAASSFAARDFDAKGLLPQQQLAFRGPSRSIRLGSSANPKRAVLAFRSLLHSSDQAAPVPASQSSRISGYLQQRTRCPREPPLLAA
jgi:hypothetical protein